MNTDSATASKRTANIIINDLRYMGKKYSLSEAQVYKIFPAPMLAQLIDREMNDDAWGPQKTKEYIEFWFHMLDGICDKAGAEFPEIVNQMADFDSSKAA